MTTQLATPQEQRAYIRASRSNARPSNGEDHRVERPLPFFTAADLHGEYRPSPYIVKRVLDPGDWLTVFGDSGALKTFFVLDMLMHVALGLDYCGHRVRRTGVLVIIGEGTEGVRKRLKAWLIRHGITSEDDQQPQLVITTRPAALISDPHAIADTIKGAELSLGAPIGVVVIDTLSSNFGPGDENDTKDMRLAMSNVRMVIGDRAVIAVHHVGHSEKGRERGSYALRGDADRRIKVELDSGGKLITVSCEKAKDDLPFKPLSFTWRVVELGWLDPDGDMLTSIALEQAEYQEQQSQQTDAGNSKTQKAVLRVLREHGAGTRRADIVSALDQLDTSNVYRAIRTLIGADVLLDVAGVIGIRGNERGQE